MRARARKRVFFCKKKAIRKLANESGVSKSLVYSYANYPTHRPNPPPDWRVSGLALQQRLGLLSCRGNRIDLADRPDFRARWAIDLLLFRLRPSQARRGTSPSGWRTRCLTSYAGLT